MSSSGAVCGAISTKSRTSSWLTCPSKTEASPRGRFPLVAARHPPVVPLAHAVEVPELPAPVAASGAMSGEEAIDAVIVEQAPLPHRGSPHFLLDANAEVAPQPL